MNRVSRRFFVFAALGPAVWLLASCNDDSVSNDTLLINGLKTKVQTVVFVYAENRSFDNIYGTFPGANGIPGVNPTGTGTIAAQKDRDA